MPEQTIKTKFYTFNQNNSGGSFDHDPEAGIGYAVAIEALSPADAENRAEDIGIYFDGCADGLDCDCCGDRWSALYSDDGTDQPTDGHGSNPIKGGWEIPSYIHRLDGTIEAVPCEGDA